MKLTKAPSSQWFISARHAGHLSKTARIYALDSDLNDSLDDFADLQLARVCEREEQRRREHDSCAHAQIKR
jgi:hypothetical protein